MLDCIEKQRDNTKYDNAHSIALIRNQAMIVRRYPLDKLLTIIPGQITEGIIRDTDILYVVPAGREYKTKEWYRLKNDKFTGTISDGEEIISKRGSIIPLLNWIKNKLTETKNDMPRVTLSRFIGHRLEI